MFAFLAMSLFSQDASSVSSDSHPAYNDPSGTAVGYSHRYPFLALTSNTKAHVVDTILKVAFDPNIPPFQFMENDKCAGIHIDIMNRLAERYGFIIEYFPVENTSKCMEYLQNGKVDVVLGVILNDNQKYKAELTDNISQSSICMIVHNNKIEDVQSGKNALVTTFEDNTITYSFVQNMSNVPTIVVSNQVRALDMLVSKRADVLVGVKSSILYQLEKANRGNEYTIVNNYMIPIEYVIAVKSGDEDLQRKINRGLQQLRISGEYERIYDRWINEDRYLTRKIIDRVIYLAMIVLAIVAAIFIFNLRLNILLKRQVSEKTKELKNINRDLENQIIETRNNNELRNCIVEHNQSSIIAFDREWKITLFNQSASNLTGIFELRLGQSVFDIELFENILFHKKNVLFLHDSRFLNEEITIRNKDEENTSYRYNIYQLFNSNNDARGALLTIEDITKEIRIKEQINERDKNKALNQIIAGIAHEIRNPLTSIKTFVELIPMKFDNVKFRNELSEFVPREIERVNNLIKNLIDYAKPANNDRQIIGVRDLIQSCAVLINHVLENEKIVLNIDIDDGLNIKADKDQLKQVLINIILNGFESMKDKLKSSREITGKLNMHIKAWKDDEHIFILVLDEGIGMTESEIKKSTEPFFTTKPNGTGLGLYISKQYMEKNGGTIVIESEKMLYTKTTLIFERPK